jgi:predicted TIM-barrel fold metal-dependent hydrolase
VFPPDVLDVIDGSQAIRSGGLVGAWDLDRRLAEMDREGVAASIAIAGHQEAVVPFFAQNLDVWSAELRFAGVQAYHRWLVDSVLDSDGRILGVGDPGPCLDMDQTVRELRWIAEHGLVSVGIPGIVGDALLPPMYDDYYDPFWAACAELGLVLQIHAGWGVEQGSYQRFIASFKQQFGLADGTLGASDEKVAQDLSNQMGMADDSPLKLTLGPRRAMWQLMLSGVFDRYPTLTLALTEMRADWVPATLAHLDELARKSDVSMARTPSEYWAERCWVTPSSVHPAEMEMRHEIGISRMMFGTDYPHPEGTWPNTLDWIRAAFVGVPEDEARLILGENAINCYGFDRDKIAAVAERIGPRPEDVLLDASTVDERVVAHFHKRSGYSRPSEDVNVAAIAAMFTEDVGELAGAR